MPFSGRKVAFKEDARTHSSTALEFELHSVGMRSFLASVQTMTSKLLVTLKPPLEFTIPPAQSLYLIRGSVRDDGMEDARIAALIKQIVDASCQEVAVRCPAPALVNSVKCELAVMECAVATQLLDERLPLEDS